MFPNKKKTKSISQIFVAYEQVFINITLECQDYNYTRIGVVDTLKKTREKRLINHRLLNHIAGQDRTGQDRTGQTCTEASLLHDIHKFVL